MASAPASEPSTSGRPNQPRSLFRDVAAAIRRRLPIFLFCVISVPGAILAISLAQPERYSATAALLFRDPQFDQRLFGSTSLPTGNLDPDREAATNLQLASLRVVARRTARELGGAISAADVAASVSVEGKGQSNLVSIVATDQDPVRAADIADEYAKQYIAFRRKADRAKIAEVTSVVRDDLAALSDADAAGPDGQLLKSRIQDLRVLSAAQTGNAELVQPADVPTEPSSPRPLRNSVLGLLLGAVLGIGFALLLDRIDRRLRDPAELEDIFGRPVLAVVPKSKILAAHGENGGLPERILSAFQMLRLNLRYFNASRPLNTLLVTSANVGEGKSTVAWGLAHAAAVQRNRVLLVEADLRRPSLARTHRLMPGRGLTDILSGGCEFTDAVQEVTVSLPTPRRFDVVVSGPLPPDPADLIDSDAMRSFLEEAKDRYDLMILDCPPASIVPDPNPLIDQVDGVLVVSGVGKTTRGAAARLQAQLQHQRARVLGVIINMAGGGVTGYEGYGYGYSDPDGALASTPDPSPAGGPPAT
jgi:polysaccharide biosynthesis transport protein